MQLCRIIIVIMNLIHSFAGVGQVKSIVTASPLKRAAGSLICLTIVPTRMFEVQIHIPGNISCYESFFKAFFNPSKVTRKHGGGGRVGEVGWSIGPLPFTFNTVHSIDMILSLSLAHFIKN